MASTIDALKVRIEGVEARIAALMAECESLKATLGKMQADETSSREPRKSQSRPRSGEFPYPVGILAQVIFPVLFRRGLVSDKDIGYLLSDEAIAEFRIRSTPVLRLDVGEDDPGLYLNNHRRFYAMPPLLHNGKAYHLTNMFYPEGREAVLRWCIKRGITRAEILRILKNATEEKSGRLRIKRGWGSCFNSAGVGHMER